MGHHPEHSAGEEKPKIGAVIQFPLFTEAQGSLKKDPIQPKEVSIQLLYTAMLRNDQN